MSSCLADHLMYIPTRIGLLETLLLMIVPCTDLMMISMIVVLKLLAKP